MLFSIWYACCHGAVAIQFSLVELLRNSEMTRVPTLLLLRRGVAREGMSLVGHTDTLMHPPPPQHEEECYADANNCTTPLEDKYHQDILTLRFVRYHLGNCIIWQYKVLLMHFVATFRQMYYMVSNSYQKYT